MKIRFLKLILKSVKIFKIVQFSIDFSTNFLIFSLASGGSAPEHLQLHMSKIY